MQVSGYFGCKENPWTVMICINPTHLICEHNSHRLWGGYWAIWYWCVSLPQKRQGCVTDFILSHEYPSLLRDMGSGERWQLPQKENKSKEAYRIIGLFSSHRGESWQHGIEAQWDKLRLEILAEKINRNLASWHAWTIFWGKYLSGAFYGVLLPNVCPGQQIVVRNIKYLVPFCEIFIAWL